MLSVLAFNVSYGVSKIMCNGLAHSDSCHLSIYMKCKELCTLNYLLMICVGWRNIAQGGKHDNKVDNASQWRDRWESKTKSERYTKWQNNDDD